MGKLIVFYGVNNLGKSTQAKLLVDKLTNEGKQAEYLKYPIYNLEPSGVILNSYLRNENPYSLTPKEAQIMYAFNREQYQDTLKSKLSSGINIIAEDYWGTGVAWGLGTGVEKKFLLELNKHFLKEDLAFLFEGKRFESGFETGHLHEENNELMEKVKLSHEELGKHFGWLKINANESIEEVAARIWNEVKNII